MAGETPDFEKVGKFLKEKWKGTVVCPICATAKWTTHGDVVFAPIWGQPSGGITLPMVAVVCDNCSYTLFFSAVRTGALPPDKKPESGGTTNG